jgi:hypothetical protein
LRIVVILVVVLVFDAAGFDYEDEDEAEDDALRVCRVSTVYARRTVRK